jgi:HEAT repeat protein
LRAWLWEYNLGSFFIAEPVGMRERPDSPQRARARAAILQIGANGIPTLLDMLRHTNSSSVDRRVDLWNRHIQVTRLLPEWIRDPSWYKNSAKFVNIEAARGFELLGAEARQAVPALIIIYEEDISPLSQAAASRALVGIGPAARAAIPSFLKEAASPKPLARYWAVKVLADLHLDPPLVVPALMKAMSDSNENVNVRVLAGIGLRSFGAEARPAGLALVPLLGDSNQAVRYAATNALEAIDPDAAARAGVK